MKKNNPKLISIFPFFLFLFFFSSISGQKPLKTIQGFVVAEGEALTEVKVTPKNFKGSPQYTRDGMFVFRGNFQTGETYLFSFEKKGYHTISLKECYPSNEGLLGTIGLKKKKQNGKNSKKKFTPFSEKGDFFKILIFPFDPYSTCKNTDKYCLENISNRFNRLNENTDFKLSIKTDKRFNVEFPMSFDSARIIGAWYNADMVVWGDYEQQCSWDSLMFNVKYITMGDKDQEIFKGNQGKNNQQIRSFRSIVEEGTLTGDIEDVAIWSMGIRELQNENYSKARAIFERIKIRPEPEYSTIQCLIGWCYSFEKKYKEADQAYENALKLNTKNTLVYLCRGIHYQQKGNSEKAIKDFERAIYLDGSSIEAHLQLSILESQSGNLRQAEKNLQKALELDSLQWMNWSFVKGRSTNPNSSNSWHNLGDFYDEQGEIKKAKKCYERSITINPNRSNSWHNLGNMYSKEENFEKAKECYEKSISIDPIDAYLSWLGLGSNYRKQGLFEKAKSCYDKSIGINPNFSDTWANLGVVYWEQGKEESAIECLQKSLELNPKSDELWAILGRVYDEAGKEEKAIECFQKGLELNPASDNAWGNLGVVYRDQGKKEKAIECFQKSLELNSKSDKIWNSLAIFYMEEGKKVQEIECLQKSIELNPKSDHVLNRLAILYDEEGKEEKAIECFQKSLELNPKSDKSWGNLGVLYNIQGKEDLAIECLQKSIELNPKSDKSWGNLGVVYWEQGKEESAIECFQKGLELNPKDAYAHNNLGNLYRKEGNLEQAKNHVQKSLSLDDENGWAYATRAMIYADEGNLISFYQNMKIAVMSKLAYPLKEYLEKEETLMKLKNDARLHELVLKSKL